MNVAGWLGCSSQGALEAGMRAYIIAPKPINAGPAVMNQRGPKRPASAPKRVEKSTSSRVPGIPASPAAAAVYPSVPCMKRPRL